MYIIIDTSILTEFVNKQTCTNFFCGTSALVEKQTFLCSVDNEFVSLQHLQGVKCLCRQVQNMMVRNAH